MNTRFPWIIFTKASGLVLLCLLFITALTCRAETKASALFNTTMQQDPYADDALSFRVLCYHDARDDLRDSFQTWPEASALDTRDLIAHFEWLQANGYHVVTLDAILAARNGGKKLPSRPILLTFDDGYVSMYTRIFPLLKMFKFPAVMGLVGEWLEAEMEGQVFYGDRWMPRENFVSWEQVRVMAASGLVEVASHSHSLHKGVLANPQGSMTSSATTRIFNTVGNTYESHAQYLARIGADLARNSALIAHHLGARPRVMIWPYGAYNMTGVGAAQAEGMPITMNLEAGPNTPDHPLSRIRRELLSFTDRVSDLKRALTQQARYDGVAQPLSRVVAVDLDAIYDPDPTRQDRNVGNLVERILNLRVNTVYLLAVAVAAGDGVAEAAYFPNRHLPMRADLLNRVAWQLRTRAAVAPDHVNVYAWLPVRAFRLPLQPPLLSENLSSDTYAASNDPNALALSPIQKSTRKAIAEIYEDLGRNAPRGTGLVLGTAADLRGPGERTEANSVNCAKTQLLPHNSDFTEDFIDEFTEAFKVGQPSAMIVRMLHPTTPLDSCAEALQSYAVALKHYDFVALMLHTSDQRSTPPNAQLQSLLRTVTNVPDALRSTVFLLNHAPAIQPSASAPLTAQLQWLQRHGARNFGYYRDDVRGNYPPLATIRPVISLETHPRP